MEFVCYGYARFFSVLSTVCRYSACCVYCVVVSIRVWLILNGGVVVSCEILRRAYENIVVYTGGCGVGLIGARVLRLSFVV